MPRRRAAKTAPQGGIRAVPLPARTLVSIGPDSEVWGRCRPLIEPDSIVRLFPPAHVENQQIEEARALCLGAGAAAVRVMPRQTAPAIVASSVPIASGLSHRQVVIQMVEESRSPDKPGLCAVLNRLMDRRGL